MNKILTLCFLFTLFACANTGDEDESTNGVSSLVVSTGNAPPVVTEIAQPSSLNQCASYFIEANQIVKDLVFIDSTQISEKEYQTEILNGLLVAAGLPGKLSPYVYFSKSNETGRDMLPRIEEYTKNSQDSLFSQNTRYWRFDAEGTFFVTPKPIGNYNELPPVKKIIPIRAYYNADRTKLLDVCIRQER
jgi:hypothetical protein